MATPVLDIPPPSIARPKELEVASININAALPTFGKSRQRFALLLGLSLLAILGHGSSWAYPGFWPGVWFGHASLILLAAMNTPRTAFFVGIATGSIANGWAFHWAPHALEICMDAPWWLSHLLFALLVIWESIGFGIFCWAVARTSQRGVQGIWLAPLAWASVEHFWPKIFPWLMGYSQLELIPLIQIADITGSCGIGFCMTAVAAIPTAIYLYWRSSARSSEFRSLLAYSAATGALLIAVLSYGFSRQRAWNTVHDNDRVLRMAVVQVDTNTMGSEGRLKSASQALVGKADLVCWPELAIGTYRNDLSHFRDEELTRSHSRESFQALRPTADCGVPILAGGKSYEPDAGADGPYAMTAFLIDSEESVRGTYHKRSLIPFGEYMPGEGYFPWLRDWATLRENIQPGTSAAPIVTAAGAKLAVVICYEDLLRLNARQTVLAGGEVIVSLINDGAFEDPLTLEQHKRLSIMRAVENRRYFLRCSSTGVTCIVAPTGEILSQLAIGGEGSLVHDVVLHDEQTLYTRYGEWFPLVCAMGCVAGLLPWRKRRVDSSAVD